MVDYLHESTPNVPKGYSSSKLNRNLSEIFLRIESKSYFITYNTYYLNNKKAQYN